MEENPIVIDLPNPGRFLDLIVHDLTIIPELSGLCVGFECGNWRCDAFAEHLIRWIPEFALSWDELLDLKHYNAIEFIRKAVRILYTTDKYKKRGEFGELILHVAIRNVFNSIPVISKIYFKSSTSDNVKGFDAVHVVNNNNMLELWLGEAKFYVDIRRAIKDVMQELTKHTQAEYLRTEFMLITNKIHDSWPHKGKLLELLHPDVSLDMIFGRLCIPILLTYDSEVMNNFNTISEEFVDAFIKEAKLYHSFFEPVTIPRQIRIHLFLLPLKSKAELIAALHNKLLAWQTL